MSIISKSLNATRVSIFHWTFHCVLWMDSLAGIDEINHFEWRFFFFQSLMPDHSSRLSVSVFTSCFHSLCCFLFIFISVRFNCVWLPYVIYFMFITWQKFQIVVEYRVGSIYTFIPANQHKIPRAQKGRSFTHCEYVFRRSWWAWCFSREQKVMRFLWLCHFSRCESRMSLCWNIFSTQSFVKWLIAECEATACHLKYVKYKPFFFSAGHTINGDNQMNNLKIMQWNEAHTSTESYRIWCIWHLRLA